MESGTNVSGKRLWDAAIARVLHFTISAKTASVHVEVGEEFMFGLLLSV